ncbi:hypothetical protein WR25_19585 [Diploscapter pachys]|uniref:Pepsin inhibitor-3-like repeated domain-containing protein n=1 Tax=Diploscapter pachys TaxID=2018661 RepID=A0A2A2LCI5_9BILA|nr:hypothetical protein WR25_19585 [Diploscapter pachys]
MLKLAIFSALIALVVCQTRPQVAVFPFPPQPQPQRLPCGFTCSVRTSFRTTVDNIFSEMRCSDGTHLDGRCHNCCVAFAVNHGLQSGNVFFAHGIRMKELNESEMKEFEDYKLALEKFKKERRAYEIYLSDLYRDKSMISPRKPSPELPERPSFCQPEQVKQHLLEGCTVQNQKIYIGNEYARDLTDKEIEELEVYTKKQQEYEKDLQKILIDNYRNIDNNNLVQFPIDEFPDIENELTEVNSDEKPTTITISKPRPAGYSLTLPSPPERPNFCTMIL